MYTVDGKNLMLEALAGVVTHVGLLDDTDTELSGGGYARQGLHGGTQWDRLRLQKGIYINGYGGITVS